MASPQEQIDSRAIELARDALSRIESHERRCDERWTEVRKDLIEIKQAVHGGNKELHDRIDELVNRWLRVAGWIIAGLLSLCGFLAARAMGWL